MKFKKIGISSTGSKASIFRPPTIGQKNALDLITTCTGEIKKWDDPIELDAINLVIQWEFTLKNTDTIPVYDKTRLQHYRIHEKEIPPTDEQIIEVIKETYSDFKIYFEEEEIDKNLTLSPLDSSLIDSSLHRLNKLFYD